MSPRISCLVIFINEDLEMQIQRKHGLCSVAGSEPPFSFYNSDSASQRASLAQREGFAELLETQRPHESHLVRAAPSQMRAAT